MALDKITNTTYVSAVIITLNESAHIGACLDSLKWCHEIVVVDSGSTDNTQEICRSRGARVFERTFDGYGSQKKYAVGLAQCDWVLALNADERATDELAAEICSMADPKKKCAGYFIPFTIEFMGKYLKWGPTRHETHLRLFRKSAGNFNENTVHESVDVRGPVGKLRSHIIHKPYDNLSGYFTKFNVYTSLMAKYNFDKGKRVHPLLIRPRFPFTFIHAFILRGGVLDGHAGFIYCFLHAVYSTIKYAKLYELQLTKNL